MTTPQQLLDIEDALVSDSNPARTEGPLDYERCARLHNYLVAYGWMAHHGREPHELDELLRRPSFFDLDYDEARVPLDRLDPSLISFLKAIILPKPGEGIFCWVEDVSIEPADEFFFIEENDLEDRERFVIVYGTWFELGSHRVGLVYDQQNHLVAIPLAQECIDSVSPVDEHLDMWFPLETVLTNWIHMIRIGKVTAGPERGEMATYPGMKLGSWTWEPYSPAQVDGAVAAMDRLTAAIEARMPPQSFHQVRRESPLLSDAELDAASVPENCFIRSVLTRAKTPRFRTIAPGLGVPHDAVAFAACQKFTGLPRNPEVGMDIPSVLIFAAVDSSRTVGFNQEIRWLFFWPGDPVPYSDDDPIPTGLYSESVHLDGYNGAEEGCRLLLPFKLRPDIRDKQGARHSDGTLVTSGSVTELFQHGTHHPFGGERRAQRFERLMDHWRELVETGVWTVGRDGVNGDIDQFKDADRGAWQDYWIPPNW